MIELDVDVCSNPEIATQREWLETNGIGGFASSTIIGMNTRRYHGLLVAATHPPVGRTVLLSRLEETVIINDRRYDLSANQYPGVIHPQGFQYLRRFRLDPFPIFTYQIEDIQIEKTTFMVQGENTTVIEYRLIGNRSRSIEMEIRPLIAFRDYHSTTHENNELHKEIQMEEGFVILKPYPYHPALYLAHNADNTIEDGTWYRNFQYSIEEQRGLDFKEDLYNPLALRFRNGESFSIIASTEPHHVKHASEHRDAEIRRRATIQETFPHPAKSTLVKTLISAADQYIVDRGNLKTIIAGYHWFGDWGRDTMIALPGLTLVTGRADIAKQILQAFAKYVDRGMLPNRFPEAGELPEYNTVDATLWYFEAVRSLLQYTGDSEFIRNQLYDVLKDIVRWHIRGTRYGIRMDNDGLLQSGEPGVQLTWMDAKVGDRVITPRHGKAVEIQALWFNALYVMKQLASLFGDKNSLTDYSDLIDRIQESFLPLFWNEERNCLYDVVGTTKDPAIRPNQVLAISLHHPLVTGDQARKILQIVEADLLTPVGLRSLSPHDPDYKPRYEGGPESRDGAYHQGTVWPWLMGPFLTAFVRTYGKTPDVMNRVRSWLAGFDQHLKEAGLGQISEIFDADPPHRPAGCMAQAWSVAELLRAIVEDLDEI